MTIAIILGIWFAFSMIVSPLIGWGLFSLAKDEGAPFRFLRRERPRFSSGKGVKLFTPQRHRGEPVQPTRRAARGRM